MQMIPSRVVLALASLVLGSTAIGQSFSNNLTDIPTGGAANSSFTENLAFADVDSDGDLDAIFADGGDLGNDRNRIWINQGGLQAGTVGVFADETSSRLPSVQDDSRDIDFADIDLDGDWDFVASNTSGVSLQGSRFYVNQGGVQAGTEDFFLEETTRFQNVGVNDGVTTFSSVDPNNVLPAGNFVDWSCDTGFVDLDNDGDMDFLNATYGDTSAGKVPTRIFLNDGAGLFEEFNPSGFQITGTDIKNGDPALWCEGTHQHDTTDATGGEADIALIAISVDFGDVDGDLDVDILHGEKFTLPRIFQNRSEETGSLGFRDVANASLPGPNWAPGLGSYEQDMGDFDEDGDLDIYGTNWDAAGVGPCDVEMRNTAGVFSTPVLIGGTCQRHNEPDFFDFDGDGDLDVFISSETNLERLFENSGSGGGYTLSENTTALLGLATAALGADTADVDQDGDYDVFVANDLGQANIYYENITQVPDSTAPRVVNLEQAPDRNAGFSPTVIRVHVYDNASWDVTQWNDVDLEYSVDSGPFTPADMVFSGGQVFRGEVPGLTVGVIDYRVRATDHMGNVGLSTTLSYTAGPCNGDPIAYCTSKMNSAGCTPSIGWTGTPSASQATGFVISTTDSRDNKNGLFFYGYEGKAVTYQGGWLCVQAPAKRTPLQSSGGLPPCGGSFSYDFNARIASGIDPNLVPGLTIYGQFWNRDPASSFNTIRTDAIQFTICP